MGIKVTGGVKVPQGKFKVTSNRAPTWTTSAGAIPTEDEGTVVSFQFEASDPEQGTSGLTFSKNSGDFPAGLSMDSAGLLTGTASNVGSNTLSDFNLRVTDAGGLFADEDFSMTIANIPDPGPQLWVWGGNDSQGKLGLGDININRSSPVQVGALVDWTGSMYAYNSNLAVKSDGTLWSWGRNNDGELGHGNTDNLSSPVQIGGDTDWANVSFQSSISLAVKTDGTLWSWGIGTDGRTGHGDTVKRSSPVQIGGLNTWSKVAVGTNHSMALKTDGTLWAWGRNIFGNLGIGNTTSKSSPVQVNLTNWADIACGSATGHGIKTNGKLYSWGIANTGRLGTGVSSGSFSTPQQVGGLSTWASIIASGQAHTHALKTDNTLWGWGYNVHGQVGDGTKTQRNSPVQVGSGWDSFSVGRLHVHAIKTNFELWGWGLNSSGQIGLGNTTNYSSPVQIGSETIWTSVAGGNTHTLAIKTTV